MKGEARNTRAERRTKHEGNVFAISPFAICRPPFSSSSLDITCLGGQAVCSRSGDVCRSRDSRHSALDARLALISMQVRHRRQLRELPHMLLSQVNVCVCVCACGCVCVCPSFTAAGQTSVAFSCIPLPKLCHALAKQSRQELAARICGERRETERHSSNDHQASVDSTCRTEQACAACLRRLY